MKAVHDPHLGDDRPDLPGVAVMVSSRPRRPAHESPIRRGIAVAEAELQAGPLGRRLAVTVFDAEADLKRVHRNAERIAEDPRLLAVIGPMWSSEAQVSGPILDDAGLLQISPCASLPALCRPGRRTFARLVAAEERQGRALARVARHLLGAVRAALVIEDDAFGHSIADTFTTPFEELGGAVVARSTYAPGSPQFHDVVAATIAGGPDVVVFGVHPVDGSRVARRIRDADPDVTFLGTDAMKPSFYLGGGDGRGRVLQTHAGADMRRLPSAACFREAYIRRYPEDSTYSPEAYDAMMLISAARALAESDNRAGVLEAFWKLGPQDGATGRIEFTPWGDRMNAPIGLYEVWADADGRVMRFRGRTEDILPME
jgi:branched-chain amino acid transport system substrate-binding protein